MVCKISFQNWYERIVITNKDSWVSFLPISVYIWDEHQVKTYLIYLAQINALRQVVRL